MVKERAREKCVCVCERERERERKKEIDSLVDECLFADLWPDVDVRPIRMVCCY